MSDGRRVLSKKNTEHKSEEFPQVENSEPAKIALELYPELAAVFYSMLGIDSKNQPHCKITVKTEYISLEEHPVKIKKLQCSFQQRIAKLPALSHPTLFATNQDSIKNLSKNETNRPALKGLASALMIPLFLGSPLEHKKIVYDPECKTFFNINYGKVFNEYWNIATKPRGLPIVTPSLNFDNLFSAFDFKHAGSINKIALEDKEFLEERYLVAFRIMFLPIPNIRKLFEPIYGKDSFIYEILGENQARFFRQAFSDDKFRKFLFTTDLAKYDGDKFIHSILSTPLRTTTLNNNSSNITKTIREICDNFTSRDKFVESVLKSYKLELDLKEFSITFVVKDILQLEELNKQDLICIEQIQKLILKDRYLLRDFKKNIIKDILINIISRQNKLEDVYRIVLALNTKTYDIIRERNENFSISLRGSGIKLGGEVICVGSRFNEIRKAAKEKMYQIAERNKLVDTLLSNSEYKDFLQTHQDGFWFGQDSLLQYIMKTRSEKKLEQLEEKNREEKEELKRQENPFYRFTRGTLFPALMSGVKSSLDFVWGTSAETTTEEVTELEKGANDVKNNVKTQTRR